MASPNLSELVSTTLRSRKKELADNVSKTNALFNRLSKKGKVKKLSGGRTIVAELDYAENATYQRYSGYDVLNVAPSDVISAAEYDWKLAAVHVSASGEELRANNGPEQTINLLEGRMTNAMRTLKNNLSTDIYSDGTASGGKQIGGLQSLLSDAPTSGTVGGIDRSAYSFWQNQLYDFSVESVTASSSTMKGAMNTLWLRCIRGNDKPDLIVADAVYYDFYESGLQDLQRYASSDMASAGFSALKYKTADFIYDGDSGVPASHMYMMNTDFIELAVHKDAEFEPMAQKEAINQDAIIVPIIFQGNLCMSNADVQGVMHA